MSAPQDYFDLFQLPRRFDIDLADLVERYRAVQAQVHPDRHSTANDQQRLQALQFSTRANEAYQALKSPLSRAAHLLQLEGVERDYSNYTLADEEFLLVQLGLRERLAGTREAEEVEQMITEVNGMLGAEQAQFVSDYEQGNFEAASDSVARQHFLYKLLAEADDALVKLEDC